jgi:hypothetical protein
MNDAADRQDIGLYTCPDLADLIEQGADPYSAATSGSIGRLDTQDSEAHQPLTTDTTDTTELWAFRIRSRVPARPDERRDQQTPPSVTFRRVPAVVEMAPRDGARPLSGEPK